MKITIIIACIATFIASLMASGCSRESARYYVFMINKSSAKIDGVAVSYGGVIVAEAGTLQSGGTASVGIITLPVPPDAEVRWSVDGKPRKAVVSHSHDVPKYPRDYTMYYIIDDKDMAVAISARDDDVSPGNGNDRAFDGVRSLQESARAKNRDRSIKSLSE